ncbi:MAG TPA: hypothetical protein VI757_13755 [Bacteroidia bacterium]|nr:hypothetical protein [Bacteroidia bacterium]
MKLLTISIFTVFVLALSNCKKNSSDSDVPNTLVDITLYLTQYPYSNLNTVGNWLYISGGVRGIVVYTSAPEQFVAIERNCTYQSSNSSAIVSVDSSYAFLEDTTCGSKFYLNDASVANGPATVPLKKYNTSYNPTTKILHIYN